MYIRPCLIERNPYNRHNNTLGTDLIGLREAAATIFPGSKIALPPEYCGVSMAMTREIVRQDIGDLHIVAVPQSGLQIDILIGAGLVASIEAAAVTMGERGHAPRFREAVERATVQMIDSTCPAIHAGLQASEKGLPFIPLRGLIGTDVFRGREDWTVLENPFVPGDRIVALQAIRPDVAIFHCEIADREGNLWIGRRRELATMAHAAKRTITTVEEVCEDRLFEDETMAAGALSSVYVDRVVHAPGGSLPLAFPPYCDADTRMIDSYMHAAQTQNGFDSWLERWLVDEQEPA